MTYLYRILISFYVITIKQIKELIIARIAIKLCRTDSAIHIQNPTAQHLYLQLGSIQCYV
jgi:hypothetical protein